MAHYADYIERECKHCSKKYYTREVDPKGYDESVYCSKECAEADAIFLEWLGEEGDI